MITSLKSALAGMMIVPAIVIGVAVVAVVAEPAFAQTAIQDGINAAKPTDAPEKLIGEGSVFTNIINILLTVIGLISVVMIIIGGIRYAVSGGDSNAVTGAKNTILYAIVGLAVAFVAYALVNWVLIGLMGGI